MGIRMAECREIITSEDTVDFFLQYDGYLSRLEEIYRPDCVQQIDTKYAVVHYYYDNLQSFRYSNGIFPKLYGLMDYVSLEQGGVLRVREQPALELRGQGVMIGIVDTGIDYQNNLFVRRDNTSRIISIWDQTDAQGTPPEGFLYGSEYKREDINRALASENPYEIVPERDEIGHGTAMAAIAAGNEQESFSGVSPLADIMVVKLKPAKRNLREYYYVADDAVCYQENDIMLAVKYLLRRSIIADRPMVICLGVGTNQGGHDGSGLLEEYLSSIAGYNGMCVVTSAGNEGNAGSHFRAVFKYDVPGILPGNSANSIGGISTVPGGSISAELFVSSGTKGFMLEMWGAAAAAYSVDIITPGGERSRLTNIGDKSEILSYIFERTTIYADYHAFESRSGSSHLALRFEAPAEGVWQLIITDVRARGGIIDIWLPIKEFINRRVYFLEPEPDITVCGPGNAEAPLTVTAYDPVSGSRWIEASRGFSRDNVIVPGITAPGVAISIPLRRERAAGEDEYENAAYSGTSISSAYTAGVAALLLEWGVIKGNRLIMSTAVIKSLLYQGAQRRGEISPNREWGYGIINIFETFNSLRNIAKTG